MMPLRPEEVRNRRFPLDPSGFRQHEVMVFLRQVADDYERAIEAIAETADAAGERASSAPPASEIDGLLRAVRDSLMAVRVAAETEAEAAQQAGSGGRAHAQDLRAKAADTLERAGDLLETALESAYEWNAHRDAGERA
jgi:DivIVA domain-containing protein